jgi:hypothetical protein
MESITRHGGRSLLLLGLQVISFGPRSLAVCPSETNLIYSPFTPFNQTEYTALTNATNNACWWWAICLLSSADAARIQQFAATSLVMGLVPLTLKDIAWPERRVVSISRQLPRLLEVFVRALGVVPSIDTFSPEKHAISSTTLYGWTLKLTRKRLILVLALSAFGLLLSYGILAVTEVYSKRSSLGCPYPIFILTWCLLAIFPAALETAFRRPARREPALEAVSQLSGADDIEQNKQLSDEATDDPFISTSTSQSAGEIRHRHVAQTQQLGSASAVQKRPGIPLEDTSPVQGRGKPWLVQLVWAVYYIAGTLVYSSIMAVTVIELFVWVITSIAVTATSKFLAFFLCMAVQREH